MRIANHRRLAAVAVVLALLLAACGSSGGTSSAGASESPAGSVDLSSRPSSPATVTITQPVSGSTVSGPTVHVVIDLQNASITSVTTTSISPTEGHIHLYVDNVLVSMNYSLEQDLPVHTGTYVLKAEFVAADHAPFNPRVWSPDVFFTVK
ncbi:MAG TPA: hypothetical protein VEG29_01435 [Candidatus Binatia bacterium]|nr:hypothetical protein [Candidatus Binatia bacterium]